jgi:hypothetical protein
MTRYTKQSDSDHSKKKSDSDERDRRLCVQFESWWVIKIARYFSRTFGFLVVFGCSLSSIWRFITLLSVFYFFLNPRLDFDCSNKCSMHRTLPLVKVMWPSIRHHLYKYISLITKHGPCPCSDPSTYRYVL